jgi:predicted SnoaL-like aldol condensation-catalyzing enzyme
MSKSSPERNKAIVLEAFETLFNKRDYAAAERFWSPKYIQHSAHIAPGREGLFNLVRSAPETLHYENQLIIAEGDYVIAHGRFTGMGRPAAWIAARRYPVRRRSTQRALGRFAGRGDQGRICERPSHVRRHLPKMIGHPEGVRRTF